MDRLWAPWRSEYIKSGPEGCIFCEAPKQDRSETLLLWSGGLAMVMLNKFPYNSGHLMVSPARHTGRLEDLSPEESAEIWRLIRLSTAILTKALNPGGFNIGMNVGSAAGAGIADHLHMHIVPRWNGDTNFMPVLADTKILPEHLKKTMAVLSPYFDSIP